MKYTERQIMSYELDQVEFSGIPTKIFICTTPRTGSWMLCRYLLNNGLGVPAEYFNRGQIPRLSERFGVSHAGALGPASPQRRRRWFDSLVRPASAEKREKIISNYIDSIIKYRTHDSIFCTKIQWRQYQEYLNNEAGKRFLSSGIYVYLYRKDLLRQAVSFHFSKLSGQWGFTDDVTTGVAFHQDFWDYDAIEKKIYDFASADAGWRAFFAKNGVDPLIISYESLVKDPNSFVVEIARRAGLSVDSLPLEYTEPNEPISSQPEQLPNKRAVEQAFLKEKSDISA